MKELFGICTNGQQAHLYTITGGGLTAVVSDLGATLVKLFVPDRDGNLADVVLGYDTPDAYIKGTEFLGATVGRNSNRMKDAAFTMNGRRYQLEDNDGGNNLHSGFSPYKDRLWEPVRHTNNEICLRLYSPHGDQGFPGNAVIRVTYTLEPSGILAITYDGVSDQDTVFNMTNHTYFNLAGHDKPELAMEQTLSMPARFYTMETAQSIPTGELRSVEGTPMDFRIPKALGRDLHGDYESLVFQQGYDHNYEVFANPCATLRDPHSGRTMAVVTDMPGVQLYTANTMGREVGKDGVIYENFSGVCLETQFYPDSVNHPEWPQPFTPANTPYHTETWYEFT